jgi:hypothetical protein
MQQREEFVNDFGVSDGVSLLFMEEIGDKLINVSQNLPKPWASPRSQQETAMRVHGAQPHVVDDVIRPPLITADVDAAMRPLTSSSLSYSAGGPGSRIQSGEAMR